MRRVLKVGGVLRISVPDGGRAVEDYYNDVERFPIDPVIERTFAPCKCNETADRYSRTSSTPTLTSTRAEATHRFETRVGTAALMPDRCDLATSPVSGAGSGDGVAQGREALGAC